VEKGRKEIMERRGKGEDREMEGKGGAKGK